MKNMFIISLLCTILILFGACEKFAELGIYNFDEATFKKEKARWEEMEIKNYNFVSREATWGPIFEIETVVKNGVKVSQKIIDEGYPDYEGDDPMQGEEAVAGTISELYLFIAITVEKNKKYYAEQKINGEMYIEYDKTFHYPKLLRSSYAGVWLEITKFEVLSE